VPESADQRRNQQAEHQCNGKRNEYVAADIEQGQHRSESDDAYGAVA
jgi:hypothetical protein